MTNLDFLVEKGYKVLVNDEPYEGKVVVGDVLEVNDKVYIVLGLNEDKIVVKELL